MKNLASIFSTVSAAAPGFSADRFKFAVPKRHGRTCSLVCINYKQKILLFEKSRISTILVATGPQDPTVYLTQSVWLAVVPPISIANKN